MPIFLRHYAQVGLLCLLNSSASCLVLEVLWDKIQSE